MLLGWDRLPRRTVDQTKEAGTRMATELEMLEELKGFDTPSITNVVATYPDNPLCLGLYNPWTENWYTDQSIRCMFPSWGPRWATP